MIDPSQMGAPPAAMQQAPPPPMDAGPEALPPETLDGPVPPEVQQAIGASMDPAALAQIALAAISQAAEMDMAAFTDKQRAAVVQVGPAIQAIIEQLASAANGPPPETLDGAPEPGMEMPPEEMGGPR